MSQNKNLPESVIESQIFHYLRGKGVLCFKSIQAGFFDPVRKVFRKQNSPYFRKGVSDCLGLLPDGRFLAIEVKARYGKVSPDQQRFIDDVNKSGGVAFVARSMEDVVERLDSILVSSTARK